MACIRRAIFLFLIVSMVSGIKSEDQPCVPVEISDDALEPCLPVGHYHFSSQGIFNIEKLIEDYPEFEKAFYELPDDEQANFIEAIIQFNDAFQEALEDAIKEL